MAKKRRKFSKEHLANLRAAHAARRGKKNKKPIVSISKQSLLETQQTLNKIKSSGLETELSTGPYTLSNLDNLYDELQKTIQAKIEKLNQLI